MASDESQASSHDAMIDRTISYLAAEANAILDDAPIDRVWRLVEWMQAHGSSFYLNWDEDDGLWECAWISGGRRFVGHSRFAQYAVANAVLTAIAAANLENIEPTSDRPRNNRENPWIRH